MALQLSDIQVYYSNVVPTNDPIGDPETGLGGAISTHANKRILSQTVTGTVMAGVTIIDAYGNPEGNGTLYYTDNGGAGGDSGDFLRWKEYGGLTYYGATLTTNGTYLVGSSAGYLEVSVVLASLTAGDKSNSLTISNNLNAVFPAVTATQSLLGRVEYHCMYIVNTSATDPAPDVTVWIDSNTPGGDTIDITHKLAATNQVAEVIADIETAPVSVEAWSAPGTHGTGIVLGTIPANQMYAIWQRRTVPVETRGTVISNGIALAISATV